MGPHQKLDLFGLQNYGDKYLLIMGHHGGNLLQQPEETKTSTEGTSRFAFVKPLILFIAKASPLDSIDFGV